MADCPTVLTFRLPRPEDADALTSACQDPDIVRWTSVPADYTRTDALTWIAQRDAGVERYLAFDDGELVGSFSLFGIDADAAYAELGYWVAKTARGRGIATRGVDWLRGRGAELGLTTFELLIHKDNPGSQGVARKAGFSDSGERRVAPRVDPPTAPDWLVYRRSDA